MKSPETLREDIHEVLTNGDGWTPEISKWEEIRQWEVINFLISADFERGVLTWRTRPFWMFKSQGFCNYWNRRYSNTEALGYIGEGYKSGKILGHSFKAHRVLWMLKYKHWPNKIDHINGNGLDNRLENLRDVSHTENMRNQKIRKDNQSGHMGIYKRKDNGKYQVNLGGKYMGVFDSIEEAVLTRQNLEVENSYHPNHGKRS